jgi:hypothetical protein
MRLKQAKIDAEALELELANDRRIKEHEIDLENLAKTRELERKLMDRVIKAIGIAMDNIGEGMYEISDLERAIETVARARQSFQSFKFQPEDAPTTRDYGVRMDANLLKTLKLLDEAREMVQESFGEAAEKQEILGKLGHLEDSVRAEGDSSHTLGDRPDDKDEPSINEDGGNDI